MHLPLFVKAALAGLAAFLISACTTGTAVMPAAGGAYTVTKAGRSGFTSLGSLRRDAFEEVNRFAAQNARIPEIISVNEVPAGFARFPQVEVRFRLVTSADRSRTKQAALTVTRNTASDAMGNTTDEVVSVSSSKEIDLYQELKNLGELRDKGLLTEDEFRAEKERLMKSRRR